MRSITIICKQENISDAKLMAESFIGGEDMFINSYSDLNGNQYSIATGILDNDIVTDSIYNKDAVSLFSLCNQSRAQLNKPELPITLERMQMILNESDITYVNEIAPHERIAQLGLTVQE